MKVSGQNHFNYRQNKPKQTTFKGYFACPIKELHIPASDNFGFKPFLKELNEKCGKYFNIIVQFKDGLSNDIEKITQLQPSFADKFMPFKWGQDNKIFLNNHKLGVLNQSQSTEHIDEFANTLGIGFKPIDLNIIGGNCFLGKKSAEENFALLGCDAMEYTTKKKIAEALEIKEKNVHIISQPNFHIDLAVRPLNYPYVLVGDKRLTLKLAEKNNPNKEQIEYIKKANKWLAKNETKGTYKNSDTIIQELKDRGFSPIKVPGLINERKMNFMNAIVHQEENGDLIYITNKTHIINETGIDFEANFEKYVKSKVPAIKEVIFINGAGYIERNLYGPQGGLHCMGCERPDFNAWNKLLQKN